MFKYLKNLVTGGKKEDIKNSKLSKFTDSTSGFFKNILLEIDIISEKIKDLHLSNYNLANRHFKKGNISEAIFRLKIVRRFWPDDKKAHFGLIYCYFIEEDELAVGNAIKELYKIDKNTQDRVEELRLRAQKYISKRNRDLEEEDRNTEKRSLSDIIFDNFFPKERDENDKKLDK